LLVEFVLGFHARGNPDNGLTIKAAELITPVRSVAVGNRLTFIFVVVLSALAFHQAHAPAGVASTGQTTSVLTYQYDNLRSGANINETTLSPANVNPSTFGKLYSFPVDSLIYGQPLYVPNLQIGGGAHNVVFGITEKNSVYAFDADNQVSTPLWHTKVGFPVPCSANQPVPGSNCNLVYLTSVIGITSTPVIDLSQGAYGAIYVEARVYSKITGKYWHVLHKYDLSTGKDMPASPAVIGGSVHGTGKDNVKGFVTFNPRSEQDRGALLLANGIVYVPFASINDAPIFHGWIFGYDATTMKRRYVFNTTPNHSSNHGGAGEQGGIWNGTVTADVNNVLFTTTGNGTWDSTVADWGNTYLKLTPGTSKLNVADYFTPQALAFDKNDTDLGTSAAILLPDQTGTYPHVMVGGDKNGTVYVVNRDNMGQYHSSGDQILQELPGAVGVHVHGAGDCNDTHSDCNYGTPAYWNGNLYFSGVNDSVEAFAIANGQLSAPMSKSPSTYGFPGATPAVSANGTTNGIVWVIEPIKSILHAYDATNLANELYNSTQAPGGRDALRSNVKFAPPTVVNGKVYVGTKNAVVVYGSLK
jgi:hypothetical protein